MNERQEKKWEEGEPAESSFFKAEKLDYFTRIVFLIFLGILLIFWMFSLLDVIFFGNSQEYIALVLSTIALLIILWTSIVVPGAARVAVIDNFFLGRFKAYKDYFGFPVPLRRPIAEKLGFKFPWEVAVYFERPLETLIIEAERFDTKDGGAIYLSAVLQYMISDFCTYQAIVVSPADVVGGVRAIVDQILTQKIKETEFEKALAIQDTLMEAVLNALRRPQEVEIETGEIDTNGKKITKKVARRLWGKDVSVMDGNFGREAVAFYVQKPEPSQRLADKRDEIKAAEFEIEVAKRRMTKFENNAAAINKIYPNVGEEQQKEFQELTEGLSTKHKVEYGASSIGALGDLAKEIIGLIKNTKTNDDSSTKDKEEKK